jgi:sigma-E factor negative regulatory protein RseC
MEAVARVVAVSDGRARLACQVQSSCESCGAGRGCGLRLLARGRDSMLELQDPSGDGPDRLVPGQYVTIAIPDADLLGVAALAYLPVLAGLLAGALLGNWLGGADGPVAAGSLLGAALGWWLGRNRARSREPRVSIRPISADSRP